MLLTRIRPALLVAACALLCGLTRADDKTAPNPRPLKSAEPAARPDDKKPAPKAAASDREQLRKELEAKFAGLTPEQTVGLLEQLAQEWGARKGAYEVGQFRFNAQVGELPRARQRLDDYKLPTAAVPPVLKAADVGAAIKVAQELAEAHAERVKRLEALKAALGAVTKAGAEFESAASAAGDHLFKMRTAAGLAKGVPADKLPAAFDMKALSAAEDRLATSAREVKTGADAAKAESAATEKALTEATASASAAAAKLESLKARQADLTAAFDYEERLKGLTAGSLTDEFNKLRQAFAEKATSIKGDEADYKKTADPVAEARAKFDAVKEPTPPPVEAGTPGSLEAAGKRLVAAQQHLAARLRTFDERAEKAAALVAALDEQERKALAYSTTLDELRRTAGQLAAAGAEIERRVGRGDLDPAKVPEGVAEAASATGNRAKLEAEATALQNLLTQLRKERDALRKPDAEVEGARALVAALLANINERIDLHTDLKKLAADYATTRETRSESEQKRINQRATERLTKENKEWDIALALDRSKQSADLAALLDAYYKELIELDEREDNLHRQKDALDKLVKLTEKETVDVTKLRGLVEKNASQAAGEEILRKIGDLPKTADGARQRAILENQVEQIRGALSLDAWLAARLAPNGLKAEADAYHAETSRLNALSGSNARRVQALTGNPPAEASKTAEQTKLPAAGGEIGEARSQLLQARARGLIILGIKILLVLLAAVILPRLIMAALRRSIRGGTDDAGNPSPVLRPVRAVLRLIIWLSALAVILSILGYDVSAMVVAIAIGVLAVALAARPMIADVLGSVAIFTERRFKVGDVVRLGGGEPARVIGLTWRSTSLKNANGLVSSVPNRAVADALVENLSRGTDTYDTLSVTVSTDKDAGKVINVIRAAMAQCKNLSPDQGVTVVSYVQRGAVKVVQYRFWWFLKDYEQRNKSRDEVFARIAVGLSHEDMTGIEIALA